MATWNNEARDGVRYVCDAEIGKPGAWHGCFRKATVSIRSVYCTLHYCERHKAHADDTSGRYFRRAPFATPQPIHNP